MELTTLNLNFWLLPRPFSADNKQRMNRFLELVRKTDPDIITLQEVWLKKYVRYLRKRLKDYHCYCSKNKFYNKSGLVTFSKIKAEFAKLKIFPQKTGFNIIEKLAKKGYLKTDFNINGKKISLINTHFYFPLTRKEEKIDEEQFELLKEITEGGHFIIAGDLNTPLEKLKIINNNVFEIDNEEKHTYATHNKYVRKQLQNPRNLNRKIDHILTRSNSPMKIAAKVINPILISDHFPLLGKITIE